MNSSSRNGARVIWLAVHTTEGIMRVQTLRDWTGWAGSSHAACDETGALWGPAQGFVPYERASWTLRGGNAISENLEQCGWARWTRAEWLARPLLLDATARWLADRSVARAIPLRRLTHAEVRARVPGVLMHDDYSKATGDGHHWDCGPGYPWDVVLAKANAYRNGTTEDDLTPDQAHQLKALYDAMFHGGPSMPYRASLPNLIDDIPRRVLAGDLGQQLRPLIAEAVAAGMAADNTDQAEEIVNRLASRLATPPA